MENNIFEIEDSWNKVHTELSIINDIDINFCKSIFDMLSKHIYDFYFWADFLKIIRLSKICGVVEMEYVQECPSLQNSRQRIMIEIGDNLVKFVSLIADNEFNNIDLSKTRLLCERGRIDSNEGNVDEYLYYYDTCVKNLRNISFWTSLIVILENSQKMKMILESVDQDQYSFVESMLKENIGYLFNAFCEKNFSNELLLNTVELLDDDNFLSSNELFNYINKKPYEVLQSEVTYLWGNGYRVKKLSAEEKRQMDESLDADISSYLLDPYIPNTVHEETEKIKNDFHIRKGAARRLYYELERK